MLSYEPAMRMHCFSFLLVPSMVDGNYRVEIPANHAVTAYASQQDLQAFCDHCGNQVRPIMRNVRIYAVYDIKLH